MSLYAKEIDQLSPDSQKSYTHTSNLETTSPGPDKTMLDLRV